MHTNKLPLQVPAIAASLAAIQTATQRPQLRIKMWRNVRALAAEIGVPPTSPILPVMVGPEVEALQLRYVVYVCVYVLFYVYIYRVMKRCNLCT
jgi:hypothetical protein